MRTNQRERLFIYNLLNQKKEKESGIPNKFAFFLIALYPSYIFPEPRYTN